MSNQFEWVEKHDAGLVLHTSVTASTYRKNACGKQTGSTRFERRSLHDRVNRQL